MKPEEARPEGQLVNGTPQQVDSSKKGFHIKFSDIRFSVPKKEILKGISGTCQPGRVLAILGSSGAGKTTLLDILACNPTPGGRVQGEILVDGVPRRPVIFRRSACYVMQRDVLLAAATVREAITTSALLKLPMSMSHTDKINKVNSILHELGLEECQNTLIGDDLMGIKGISGGQRRRVSIGIEIIKDPRVIFLDEPTSGLDSEMAAALMHTLKGLSRLGRTVVLTIHQPNSLITSEFDDFMLLSGGETVYNGAWEDAVAFFAAAGLQCPAYSNPTDFFLHTLQEPDNVKLLVNQQKEKEGIQLSESKKNLSADEENVLTEVEGVDKPVGNIFAVKNLFCGLAGKTDKEEESKGPGVPGWYQVKVLAARNLRNYMRNPVMFFSETAQYAFMGVFVGLMYLRLNNSVETGVQDRLASLWFGMAVLSFTPSFTAATVWDRERILLRREASQSLYSVTSWFAAKSAVVIPMQIAQTLLFGLIAFFMVGYVFFPFVLFAKGKFIFLHHLMCADLSSLT